MCACGTATPLAAYELTGRRNACPGLGTLWAPICSSVRTDALGYDTGQAILACDMEMRLGWLHPPQRH